MNSFFFINYYAKQTIINDLQLATGKWIEYDDDNPIAQREEDILKLSGGGRAHMGTNSCFSILNFHSPNRNSLEMDPLLTTNNVSFWSFTYFRWLAHGIHMHVQGSCCPQVISFMLEFNVMASMVG